MRLGTLQQKGNGFKSGGGGASCRPAFSWRADVFEGAALNIGALPLIPKFVATPPPLRLIPTVFPVTVERESERPPKGPTEKPVPLLLAMVSTAVIAAVRDNARIIKRKYELKGDAHRTIDCNANLIIRHEYVLDYEIRISQLDPSRQHGYS
jgi:hypothetical protein